MWDATQQEILNREEGRNWQKKKKKVKKVKGPKVTCLFLT